MAWLESDEEKEEGGRPMFDISAVTERLKALGYEAGEGDAVSLAFCIEKVRNKIKTKTHQKKLPRELEYTAIDMAAGEFLLAKKTFAPDSLTGLDLNAAVKQVQIGDTNTVFATGEGSLTAEQRLDALISRLLSGEEEILHYRRLKW